MPHTPELLARFAAIVGDRNALRGTDVEPHLTEPRGNYRGHTPLVLRPASRDEVVAIVKLAAETKTPLVTQGGNTGLVGAQIPHEGEIVMALTRLNAIREVDAASNTMTCESGVVLAKAQEAAEQADRLFPLSLGSEGSCTIGGNLSSNAGGTAALAYGVARDLVVGLEVVLADGRVWNGLSKLKKDNTGYDLKNLFVGAEGTLGIITAAVLKIFPRPHTIETAFVGLSSPRAALDLLTLAQGRSGNALTSFELIASGVFEMALKHGANVRDPLAGKHPWYVLLEVSSQQEGAKVIEGFLGEAIEREMISDATIAATIEQRKALWHMRHELSDAQKPEGGSIKNDVSVPVATVPEFLDEATAAVLKLMPDARPVPFGHLGDGNIHFNISQPAGGDKAAFMARREEINAAVDAIVLKHGGSISAEHGIGTLKRATLAKVKDPVALDMMRALKRTLDPDNILNPGKIL